MPIPLMTFDEYVVAQGLVFRAELGYTGVSASTGVAYTGITTGADEIAVLQRAYSSSEAILQVELFEATFTAGAAARVLNRRFASQHAVPATVMQGVTPDALTTVITAGTFRASTGTGQASVSVPGDDSRLYLKPNTSYVVRYTNLGINAATIGNSFDFRKTLKGSWDGVLVSA